MKLWKLLSAGWVYRGFIISSIVNEFKSRLTRSKLGLAWLVLQPLAQVVVFATILSNVLAARLDGVDNRYAYAMYLLAGIACWNLFNELVLRCTTVFVDQASLIRKMNFPRIVLPAVVAGSALVANACLMLVLVVAALVLGFIPSWAWLWLPLFMLLTAAFASGLGLLLGTLHVFARDVGQMLSVVLQFWFWATPIVYPARIVPESFAALLRINPLVPLVEAYQNVILLGQGPSISLWYTVAVTAVLLAMALVIFRRAASELVDVL